MKGIRVCGECASYDLKKHRCRKGFNKESNPFDPFFDDCDLPDVDYANVRGKWIPMGLHKGMENFVCSACNGEFYVPEIADEPMYRYCPGCGALMNVEENDG